MQGLNGFFFVFGWRFQYFCPILICIWRPKKKELNYYYFFFWLNINDIILYIFFCFGAISFLTSHMLDFFFEGDERPNFARIVYRGSSFFFLHSTTYLLPKKYWIWLVHVPRTPFQSLVLTMSYELNPWIIGFNSFQYENIYRKWKKRRLENWMRTEKKGLR